MAGVFQSTLPARGATDADVLFLCNVEFQSTLPARGATESETSFTPAAKFQSTLPARGATDHAVKCADVECAISIHAPRTGSDAPPTPTAARSGHFNPRSPHGERPVRVGGNSQTCYFNPRSPHGERQNAVFITNDATVFQSTLPARGATRCNHYAGNVRKYFNPRSPHGERPCRGYKARHEQTISIHAPRTGSDVVATNCNQVAMHFNPRSPHGERPAQRTWTSAWRDFNPRSPHGERHGACAVADTIKRFQSTLPARGATPPTPAATLPAIISIHAPRTGSDGCHL